MPIVLITLLLTASNVFMTLPGTGISKLERPAVVIPRYQLGHRLL